MTDETLSHVAEPAAPAIVDNASQPADETVNLQEPVHEDGDTPQVEATAEPDDYEEIEWSGKTFKAPKGLKDGLLMQADYTRKTQEVAATRKELEERAKRIEQQSKASEEELTIRAGLHHITSELARLEGFGWDEYQQARQNDPFGADEAWNYIQHLKGQKAESERKISEQQQARTQDAQREIAKRIEDTKAFARTLPGWSPEMDSKVIDFAKSNGVTEEQLMGVINPEVYKILNLARMGADLLSKQANPAPKPQTATPAPLAVVGGKSNPTAKKSLADMDMEEYVAARKAGRKG